MLGWFGCPAVFCKRREKFETHQGQQILSFSATRFLSEGNLFFPPPRSPHGPLAPALFVITSCIYAADIKQEKPIRGAL